MGGLGDEVGVVLEEDGLNLGGFFGRGAGWLGSLGGPDLGEGGEGQAG